MTQINENEMKESVREFMKSNPQNFWKDLFSTVDHYVGVYVEQLEKQGVDLDYLEYKIEKTISSSPFEGVTLKEKLGSLISPLEKVMSELNRTYLNEKKRKNSFEELKKEIQEKEVEIKKLKIEKENLEAISKATESELATVRDQTLYDLEEEMKDIRTFLMRLPEDIKSLENNGDVLPDKFKKRIHRGIQDAYTILQEAKLWQYDAKPEEVKFNKEERRARLNQNKSNEVNDITILELSQDEQNLTKQLSEEKVTQGTTDTNTSFIEKNADQQTLAIETEQVDKDVKENANIKDEETSEETNKQNTPGENSTKDPSALDEMPREESVPLKEDDTPLNKQNAEDLDLEDQGKTIETIENVERRN